MRLCDDAIVRTTIDRNQDALEIAKTVAREQNKRLGQVISEFITGTWVSAASSVTSEDGRFPTFRCVRRVTSEDVRAMDDDEQ